MCIRDRLHIVPEGEERIAAHGNTGLGRNPFLFLLGCKGFRLHLKFGLPYTFPQHILILIGQVHVNGVVPVRTAEGIQELETQSFGVLAKIPVVRLVPRQAGAVDAALLARPHANGLSVLYIADGIGLGV